MSSASRPRMIVPDVARGMALLGIAMANMTTAWIITTDRPGSYFGGIIDGSAWDKAAVVFSAFFVHNRGLPMFSTLLGFGVGLIALSLWRRGFPVRAARWVIAKRYAFLALMGAVHMVLLFWGDIMFFYGVAGIVIAFLLRKRDSTLMLIAYILFALCALGGVVAFISGAMDPLGVVATEGIGTIESYPDLLLSQLITLGSQALATPIILLMYLPVMLVGFVWARQGVLADVPSHRPTLLRWVAIAAAITVVIGTLWSLSTLGVIEQRWANAADNANAFIGVFTGPGILAGLALLLQPVQERLSAGAPAFGRRATACSAVALCGAGQALHERLRRAVHSLFLPRAPVYAELRPRTGRLWPSRAGLRGVAGHAYRGLRAGSLRPPRTF